MPIYEYKCLDCGKHIEKMRKVSDEPLVTCEVCGGKLEKQWSLSGFQFKGAGWYVTDYSSKLKDTSAEASKTNDKAETTEKTNDKAEKADASGNVSQKTEKSSATESTVAPQAASNKSNNNAPASSKTDTVSKKE